MTKNEKEFFSLLKEEGIRPEVIEAFKKYNQDLFFDKIFSGYFYSDETISIGNGEKADPSIALAKMINYFALNKKSRVLEIGTGSGYSTAVMSRLFDEIITVEYHEELASLAKERLNKLKINNVKFLAGDIFDFDGLTGKFDGIIIFAACSSRPLFLMPYLKEKGLMVFPMGPVYQQQIIVMINEPGANKSMYRISFYDLCNFTPLKGM